MNIFDCLWANVCRSKGEKNNQRKETLRRKKEKEKEDTRDDKIRMTCHITSDRENENSRFSC